MGHGLTPAVRWRNSRSHTYTHARSARPPLSTLAAASSSATVAAARCASCASASTPHALAAHTAASSTTSSCSRKAATPAAGALSACVRGGHRARQLDAPPPRGCGFAASSSCARRVSGLHAHTTRSTTTHPQRAAQRSERLLHRLGVWVLRPHLCAVCQHALRAASHAATAIQNVPCAPAGARAGGSTQPHPPSSWWSP
jgi:hypothetical protein